MNVNRWEQAYNMNGVCYPRPKQYRNQFCFHSTFVFYFTNDSECKWCVYFAWMFAKPNPIRVWAKRDTIGKILYFYEASHHIILERYSSSILLNYFKWIKHRAQFNIYCIFIIDLKYGFVYNLDSVGKCSLYALMRL